MNGVRAVLLLALFCLPVLAHADDAVYPPGSRVGLVPPSGFSPSRSFTGFEDRTNRVAIVLAALPPEAFAEIEKSAGAEALLKQGITLDSREDISHPLGKAFLVIGHQQADNTVLHKWILVLSTGELTALVTIQIPDAAMAVYPAAVLRKVLASVAVRPSIPVEEQLSLLPFGVSELAGFRVGGVIPGRALMLTDGTVGASPSKLDTHIVIAVVPGGPAQTSERDSFARDVFSTIPNLKDVHITTSEPLRIGGQQGHQIMATGRDGATGAEVTIVQWLRFGGGAFLHMIGVAPTEAWTLAYGRFRQVRDGIEVH